MVFCEWVPYRFNCIQFGDMSCDLLMTLPMEKGSETYKQVGTGLGFPKKILKDL